MKNTILLTLFITACTLEVPVDKIEVPPVENTTQIILSVPDGFGGSSSASNCDTMATEEVLTYKKLCEFKELPDYNNFGGQLINCKSTCCYWSFPETRQTCEEKWCLDLDDKCGWKMISWHCYNL